MEDRKMTFREMLDVARSRIQNEVEFVGDTLTRENRIEDDTEKDTEEAHENLILALRHLEDARMRLGKTIQACEGGESIYDKE